MIDNRTKQVDTPKLTAHPGITEQTPKTVLPNKPAKAPHILNNHEDLNKDYIEKVPTPKQGFASAADNTQSVR